VVFVFAAALLTAPPSAAADERPLIVERVDVGVWRADAQGVIVEFVRNPDAALSIGFLGQDGQSVTPPPAIRGALRGSEAAQAFALAGRVWVSTGRVETLEDGSMLSIVEGDHHHARVPPGASGNPK